MTTGPIIDPERVHSYRYRILDRCLLTPTWKRLISGPALRLVPRRLSGNLLTVCGNGLAWLSFLFLAGAFVPMPQSAEAAPLLLLLPAAGIFLYHVLDTIDGAQARRNGSSGPLGEFLDHWLDALNIVTVPLGVMVLWGYSGPAMAAMTALFITTFWASTWEQNRTGTLQLRPVSVMEGVLVVVALYAGSALIGPATTPLAGTGVSVSDAITAFAVCAFSATTLLALRRIGQAGALSWQAPAGLAASLLPLMLWQHQVTLTDGLGGIAPQTLTALLIGVVGVKHVGDLHRQRLIGARYRPLDVRLVALGLGLNLSLVWLPSPDIQRLLLLGSLAVVAAALLHQLLHTVRYIADSLNIGVLRLTPEQLARMEEG